VPDTAKDIEPGRSRVTGSRRPRQSLLGGLGPTSDDLTRDLIAALLGKKLREDPGVLAHIRQFFEIRKRPMPERTAVQALVPEGAVVLPNPHGTAPGLAIEVAPIHFVSMANQAGSSCFRARRESYVRCH